jgi:hypothetical protein
MPQLSEIYRVLYKIVFSVKRNQVFPVRVLSKRELDIQDIAKRARSFNIRGEQRRIVEKNIDLKESCKW